MKLTIDEINIGKSATFILGKLGENNFMVTRHNGDDDYTVNVYCDAYDKVLGAQTFSADISVNILEALPDIVCKAIRVELDEKVPDVNLKSA